MPAARLKTITFPARDAYATPANDPALLAHLTLRRETAQAWLDMPEDELATQYAGAAGQRHRKLSHSGLLYHPLSLSDIEFRAALRTHLAAEKTPRCGLLLAAMLYLVPHEFPRSIEISAVPGWLRADYAGQMLLPPPLFRQRGEAAAYREFMQHWVSQLRDFIAAAPRSESGMHLAQRFGEASYFHSLYFNSANARKLFKQRAEILESSLDAINYPLDWTFPPRAPQPRLRLGVLALDFQARTETFATLPVFRDLDRSRFEIILFALRQDDSAMERFCRQHADRFVCLPTGLLEQVQLIREADLDLVFLGGNVTAAATDLAALTLHRLARVQVASICCCVTTGMRNVDCFLSGVLSEPADGPLHYTEKLYLIDGPAHCFDYGESAPAVSAQHLHRAALDLPRDAIVFASGANFHKILPELETVWLRILASVPGSRLMLYPFNPNWDGYSVTAYMMRLGEGLRRHDIDPARILVLEAAPDWGEVMQRLRLADVYLDSFPFCGATSLLDPLLAGLPVVAMDGNSHRSIQGAAILRSLGLDELVAADVAAYIRLALRLAANRRYRKNTGLRIEKLMRSAPAVFDHAAYAAKATGAFEQMWQDYCDGRLRAG